MQLIRALTQTLPDGRTREMSLYRSDSFLYLVSLIADPRREDGLWIGEAGVCLKPMAGNLLKELRDKAYRSASSDQFMVEARITHGASVERDGKTGPLRMEPCSDYETVTLSFAGRSKLEIFLGDLEAALAWAA
ncbi:hypothetical protein K8R04_02070 [Candidatus Uhrbacteria bacterium]|nr:hypothetical protein [Candidatus Uhrbacteria bacterium]